MDFLELMMSAHDDELDDPKDAGISAVDETTETIEAVKDWRVGKKRKFFVNNSGTFSISQKNTQR
jgi:hypothetical protein